MNIINIVGLGPGNIKGLTLEAVEKMESGKRNYLRTENHPTVKYLVDRQIGFESFDAVYNEADNFEEVYETIALRLVDYAREQGEVNYLVPGNPLVAENSVKILLNMEEEDLEVRLVSGISFIEPMLELLGKDPINGLKIVDGIGLRPEDLDLNTDTIVTQVYSRILLSEIKLVLAEVYGDEHQVYFIQNAGMDSELKRLVAIYELDRELEIGRAHV